MVFPYVLTVCCAFTLMVVTISAQSTRRQLTEADEAATGTAVQPQREDAPVIISMTALGESTRTVAAPRVRLRFSRVDALIAEAIDARLGSRYSWGATGPSFFDCSGFVWSTFQSAGISFERASARTLWARFLPPTPEEEFKFGTLVFFSGLTHVGIVADEHGFYHASRHHGVVYAPFNEYWLSRIDGFRRVPLPVNALAD
jgi:peptidoglycan DL-endopeptidase CwlO